MVSAHRSGGGLTWGQQQGRGRGRSHLGCGAIVRVEMSHLDAVSVTGRRKKLKGLARSDAHGHRERARVPPVDEDAHQHQQTHGGERGDDGQRDDSALLHLHGSHQAHARLVAAVVAL